MNTNSFIAFGIGTLLLGATYCRGVVDNGPATPAGNLLESSVTAEDIDVKASRAYQDGVELPKAGMAFSGAMGLAAPVAWQMRGESGDAKDREVQFILVLNRAVPLGTLLATDVAALSMLNPDLAAPAEGAPVTNQWRALPFNSRSGGSLKIATLPPGTTVKALLLTCRVKGDAAYGMPFIRLCKSRFCNNTPAAVANAESEYTCRPQMGSPFTQYAYYVTEGYNFWQNTGPDNEKRIPRVAVSDVAPSWFQLSWNESRKIAAIYLEGNYKDFTLHAFRGPAGINPALGTPEEWFKLRGWKTVDPAGRLILLAEPVTTRGLKLTASKLYSSDKVAVISALHIYADLGNEAVPDFKPVADHPPFKIPYTVTVDGTASMVVNDAAGRRIANLLGRESRKQGEETEYWDLKDYNGAFVAPGSYTCVGLQGPVLKLAYQTTPYPNVEANDPENTPWLNGESGPGGWMADHSTPSAVCAAGDRVYLSSPCSESGVSLIECDLTGRKLWGHANFAAWTGPSFLAGDALNVYGGAPGNMFTPEVVWQVNNTSKATRTFISVAGTSSRNRGMQSLAISGGKLFMSIRASENWLGNANTADEVDIEKCLPFYRAKSKNDNSYAGDSRTDFLRMFRITGTPPGQSSGLTYLDSTDLPSSRQYILLAFNKPVPLGSLIFPHPEGNYDLRFSLLKADGKYPPNPKRKEDWVEFYRGRGRGWTVLPAPTNVLTRALLVTFDKGQSDVDDIVNEEPSVSADGGDLSLSAAPAPGSARSGWKGQMEGMKLLRRRFAAVTNATVRVNSGSVSALGEWEAQRTKPLSPADPGIYLLEWKNPQGIRGLAIKEIDGKKTEIDVFEGRDGTPVDLTGTNNWKQIASYEQTTRYYYNPDVNQNCDARYMDGYVDFGQEVKTRAIRLRVVEQWTSRGEGRDGLQGVRRDHGGMTLDPARCRVYGVAALQYLGGEIPVDPISTDRVESWNLADGKLAGEFHLPAPGDLAALPDGLLLAVSGTNVVTFNPADGKATPLPLDVIRPGAVAVDARGSLYVFDQDPSRLNVRVFSREGKALRTIGTPGGFKVGPWDPTRIATPGIRVALAIDAKGQLWVTEANYNGKRTTLWAADGTFLREMLGNTAYGGGGCLDPYDTRRLYYAAQGGATFEFELDWTKGPGGTRLKNLLWLGDSPGGEVPIMIKDRLYLVTRREFETQKCGVVYLYEKDHLRRVAAMGLAGGFAPLRTPEIMASLGAQPLENFQFVWSDRNGDGKPQVDEIVFTPAHIRGVNWFDRSLGIQAGTHRYEVKEFTSDGVPIYMDRDLQAPTVSANDSGLLLPNGQTVFFRRGHDKYKTGNVGIDSSGKETWFWPTEGYGVHALYSARPYFVSQVVAEFGIVGAETAPVGDLGGLFVTHNNVGSWNVWTTDGILASRIFLDIRDGRRQAWSMREHQRGLDLSLITVGQEHFTAYFCRSQADNKYYVVSGHNHVSVVEVEGLDQFKRFTKPLEVKAEDIRAAQEWDQARQSRVLYQRAPLITCTRLVKPPVLDGSLEDWPETPSAVMGERGDAAFWMGYDDKNLYAAWKIRGHGPLKNNGNDWHRIFKTGAAVDLQIGVNPEAPFNRKGPAVGDSRLVLTMQKGVPKAVFYRPNEPGAPKALAWETHTMVFRSEFDRVEEAKDVTFVAGPLDSREGAGYVVEASIPLARLGLNPKPGLRLKMDWGFLESGADGNEVLQRQYWANQSTRIIADEASEAQLSPGLWGYVLFAGKTTSQLDQLGSDNVLDGDKGKKMSDEEVLDLLGK